jgi:cellobiose phosphorylase
MYRLILESLLGVSREKDRLRFAPCLPVEWTDLKIRYTYGATVYDIEVQQRRADAGEESVLPSVTRDGVVQSDNSVLLVDDLASHRVVVEARTARA